MGNENNEEIHSPQDIEESESNEIVPVSSKDIETIEKELDRRLELFQSLKVRLLKLTTETNWELYRKVSGDYLPRLNGSGASKVIQYAGLSISGLRDGVRLEHFEDDLGKFYMYSVCGKISRGNVSMDVIGTCSSRDKLYARRHGEWRELSEINPGDIQKKAVSNFYVNAATRFLALQKVTLEELTQAGLDVKKIDKVEFKKGEGRKKSKSQPTEKASSSKGTIEEGELNSIFNLQKARDVSDEKIKTWLKKKYGIESRKDIPKAEYQNVIKWIKQQSKEEKPEKEPEKETKEQTKKELLDEIMGYMDKDKLGEEVFLTTLGTAGYDLSNIEFAHGVALKEVLKAMEDKLKEKG